MKFVRFCCLLLLAGVLCGCHALTRGVRQEVTTNPVVALALPTSGSYAGVAGRIKRGALAAVAELKSRGINTQLVDIDTSKSGWQQRLAQLPTTCAVVGGPLGEANYTAARKAGLMANRLFFSFMPTLAQGDEGKLAWRFFPSPQDQIDALTTCLTDKLNIRTVGAFYPDDAYGRRMTALLEKSLAARGIAVRKAPYNAKAPASWSAAVRPLIQPVSGGAAPIPRTNFEALFVPDSWRNMGFVTTALKDNGEDRLVLLGTTLWEQGMKGRGMGKVELGLFPMAWNSARLPQSLKGGDFWTALGYDFVKFASHLGLAAKPSSVAETVARADNASRSISVLAPMRWDASGVSHQALYMYQVRPQGIAPLNASSFQQSRQSLSERAALRLQQSQPKEAEDADMNEKADDARQEKAAPVSGREAVSGPTGVEPTGYSAEDAAEARKESDSAPSYMSAPGGSEVRGASSEQTLRTAAPTPDPVPTPTPQPAQGSLPDINGMPHTSYKLSLPVKR